MIELARQYGRYGYRRIAALLRDAGWQINDKRVERLWRREGLKVPYKQPKRGRLWLNDGSCVRLRAEHRNHVWSYDFVEDRTQDGRKYRMLNVIDEYTHECLAIRVARRLRSTDIIDVLSDLFILRGVPGDIRSDNGPEFVAEAVLADAVDAVAVTGVLAHHADYVPGLAVPLFDIVPPTIQGVDWFVKRAFDLLISTTLLLLLSPLLLISIVMIRLTSPGPILFRDQRVGLGEQPFAMLKLRSMVTNAAQAQAELEEQNEADGALFKIRNDPRVTPVGRVLRRFSIDELPQLLNVIKGEMSLVGPRPLPMRDYQLLEQWHRRRYSVLPGITGLWQVSGRSNLGFDTLVRLDFYYLESWTIWMDIAIIARTPLAIMRGRGAYCPLRRLRRRPRI